MREYKIAQIQKYLGKYILVCVRENKNTESKSLNIEFKTCKEAISHFKCFYAPIRTKIVKISENIYEAI